MMIALIFLPWAADARADARACREPLLRAALIRAGGRAALEAARTLSWRGTARVFAGGKTIDIGVSTTLHPYDRARSDSWPLSEGPSATRSLIIDGDQGWMVRDGRAAPMPAAMLKHERAQYALYGLMRLADLCAPDARVVPLAPEGALRGLLVRHPRAPATRLYFDADDRLARAEDTVPSPDGGPDIAQTIVFSGQIGAGGVRWPRELRIEQGGAPYFELRLDRLTVSRGP